MRTFSKFRPVVSHASLAASIVALAAGCTVTSGPGGGPFEYRTEAPRSAALDVPPDLTSLPRDGRYTIPGSADAPGTATASAAAAVAQSAGARPDGARPASVAPASTVARIERAGTQRWLAVETTPEQAYAVVKAFWPSVGLAIERDDPQAGVIETVWAENRAKLPQDLIRRTIGKVLDGLYSTGEQDKYRARIERTAKNTAEIYVSQRKMVVQYTGTDRDRTVRVAKDGDLDLEAEMLQRIALQFQAPGSGATAATASAPVASAAPAAPAVPTAVLPTVARLVPGTGSEAGRVEVNEPFDRAWRRVGLALDRGGFTVEDRDRTRGLYFVRYLDPEYEAKVRANRGIFTRIFNSDAKVDAQQFRVLVTADGDRTRVAVQDKDGKPETSETGKRILQQLNEQLR